ncbi:hypothetical protein SAMN05421740_103461 [Parapedobacter koreensis]|uniref:Uncharacterized protein n=1 Tax=Parapedobacter koreensis TaxID=332977 RepID=A0A1H7MCR5_9SPHI|nr:hypothetical protein SAMN05421740_103461 [Parapedobacter koreensis]
MTGQHDNKKGCLIANTPYTVAKTVDLRYMLVVITFGLSTVASCLAT